jgi:WD40 repeat protein
VVGTRMRKVNVYDAETGQELRQFELPGGALRLNPDLSLCAVNQAVRREGETVSQTQVQLLNTQTGEVRAELGRYPGIAEFAFHPDGRRILVGPRDLPPRLYDLTGRELLTLNGPPGSCAAPAFSLDGNFMASTSRGADRPGELRLWDLRTGDVVHLMDGHPEQVNVIAFSPDGRRLVTASADRTLKVWDTRSGRELITLAGHDASVLDVSFTPDGHLLVTRGANGAVLVWDGSPYRETPGRVRDLSAGVRGKGQAP